MNLLTNDNALLLWRDTIKNAEEKCAITLPQQLETYLISLLNHYTNKPELAKRVLATALLEAHQSTSTRNDSLKQIGDHCLLYAGLFPQLAEKKLVKISYFVNIGRFAYHTISQQTNDLFGCLAFDFVVLMDVLQSIRPNEYLMPIEAFDLWRDVGSKRALQILNGYTHNKLV